MIDYMYSVGYAFIISVFITTYLVYVFADESN